MVSPTAMVKAASKSRHHSQKHAAILFKGGAVMSIGTNNPSAHAEVVAMEKTIAYWTKGCLKKYTLLSVRIGKSGKLRNARPCSSCYKFIRESGIRVLLYSTDTGEIIREKL